MMTCEYAGRLPSAHAVAIARWRYGEKAPWIVIIEAAKAIEATADPLMHDAPLAVGPSGALGSDTRPTMVRI